MFTALWNWWNGAEAEKAAEGTEPAAIEVPTWLPKWTGPGPADSVCVLGPRGAGKTTLVTRLTKGVDVHVVDTAPASKLTVKESNAIRESGKPVYWTTQGSSVVRGSVPRWVCISTKALVKPMHRRQLAPELTAEQFKALFDVPTAPYSFVVFDAHSEAPLAKRVWTITA